MHLWTVTTLALTLIGLFILIYVLFVYTLISIYCFFSYVMIINDFVMIINFSEIIVIILFCVKKRNG